MCPASGIRPTVPRSYKKRNGEFELRDYTHLVFHDCRHAWVPWCLASGMQPTALQEFGDWEDLKSLQIYSHYIPSGFEVDLLNAAVERESSLI